MGGGYKISNQYGMYFLTFTIVGWIDIFTRLECRNTIIDSLKYCQKEKGLVVHAYVIMSNHIHLILRAKEGSKGLSMIIADFKKYTSKSLRSWLNNKKESRRKWMKSIFITKTIDSKNYFKVWKSGNRPIELLHSKFTLQKLDYIHNNPVVNHLVDNPENYIYSSARNYLVYEKVILDVELIDF